MKTLNIEDNLYKELQELASLQKVEMEKLLEGVLYEGGYFYKREICLRAIPRWRGNSREVCRITFY
jgi:hypothetical protein